MANCPVSGTPGNCICGGSTASTGGSWAERMRKSATAEMRNQAIFVTTDGHASWNAPLTMKAQAPRRFAIWKPRPAFNQPMETARYALSIATAPAQPESSHSSSMMSFHRWRPTAICRAEGRWRAINVCLEAAMAEWIRHRWTSLCSTGLNSNYEEAAPLDQLHSTEDMV